MKHTIKEMTDDEYVWHRLKRMPKKPKGQDAFDNFKGYKPSEEDLSGAKFARGDEVTFNGRFATVRFVKNTPGGFKYHIGIKGAGDEATTWAWVDEDEISPTRSVNEGRKRTGNKDKNWMGVPGARFIYHGDWNDPEIVYDGFSINYFDVESVFLDVYREEHPEDDGDNGFDEWFKNQDPSWIQGVLDDSVYASYGDQIEHAKPWCGIKDAYLLEDIRTGDKFVMYKGKRIEISEFEYYDKDYDDYFTYENDPQGFESYYNVKRHRGELIDMLDSAERKLYTEGVKELWDKTKQGAKNLGKKVANGAKKVAKKVGDAFKGPFRKGDHIMISGEDGEKYKGTITGWDLDNMTYNVMIGNAVDEGSQEDALAMPNRIKEIEAQLQNNTQRLYNMLADEYLDNEKQFDELLEERDALVEELCGCRGLVKEETYEDKVHREWLDAVQKHKSERQAIKDRIRDIVGDDKADDVFEYWDRIQSSFNMRWKERDGFSGTDNEHLARLAKILGPEGKDIIDDINAKFGREAKELSDYYATHDYTGD